MSIKLAILGILSWKPATGYDLKKVIEDSSAMYWSGNNNQIYRSLVQLLEEGLVTNEVHHQTSSPSKKIYTITEEGLAELKDWVLAAPELPEFKKSFLTQLAWADLLTPEELNSLLTRYEEEIRMHIVLLQEKKRRGPIAPNRTPRESYIWEMIDDNIRSSYQHELQWVQNIQKELGKNHITKEVNKMNYQVIESNNHTYIACTSADTPISTEQDALDLIALCMEHNTALLLLHEEALSEDFFKLKTRVAGNMLQKFTNYRVKTATVISSQRANTGKFKELVQESNKGNQFAVFTSIADAEKWLLNTD